MPGREQQRVNQSPANKYIVIVLRDLKSDSAQHYVTLRRTYCLIISSDGAMSDNFHEQNLIYATINPQRECKPLTKAFCRAVMNSLRISEIQHSDR